MHLWSINVGIGGWTYTYEIGGTTFNTPFIINSTILAGDDICDFATLNSVIIFNQIARKFDVPRALFGRRSKVPSA